MTTVYLEIIDVIRLLFYAFLNLSRVLWWCLGQAKVLEGKFVKKCVFAISKKPLNLFVEVYRT